MNDIVRCVFVFAVGFTFVGCANLDRYNRNPFYKEDNHSRYISDSNKYRIIPFSSETGQSTYASNLNRAMATFGLTVVDDFDNTNKGSDEASETETVSAKEFKSENDTMLSDNTKQSISETTSTNADKGDNYVIKSILISDSDGTVEFIKLPDKKVMGIFSISPYVYKMRPQLYAALVKMRLLKNVRY